MPLSSSNNVDLTLDFGYRFDTTLARYDVGDFVWLDADRDGFQDPGEQGIEGVTLDLLAEDGTLLGTATTDATGAYLFPELDDGEHAALAESARILKETADALAL